MMYLFKKAKIDCLPALMSHVKGNFNIFSNFCQFSLFDDNLSQQLLEFFLGNYEMLATLLRPEVEESQIENIFNILTKLPRVEVTLALTTGAGENLPFKSGKLSTIT